MTLSRKAKFAFLFLTIFCAIPTFGYQSAEDRSEAKKQRQAKWSKTCDSWVGLDINDLIRKWGAPTSDYRMPDGDVIYRWSWTSSYTDPVELYPDGSGGYYSDGGDTMNFVCNTEFTTSPNGVIYDWKWNGNNC